MTRRPAERDDELAALMREAQEGDGVAYTRLLVELAPLLRRTVRRRRGFLQAQDMEDLVQDILLSVHAARATYDPERPFLPWLMAIARNRMADGIRRHLRRAEGQQALERDAVTFGGAHANTGDEHYGDPDALRNAVRQLPDRQRRAVEMTKLDELSLKEASERSGISVGALKVAVSRGIRSLRGTLKREARPWTHGN